MGSLTIKMRLIVGFGLMMLALAVISALAIRQSNSLTASFDKVVSDRVAKVRLVNQTNVRILDVARQVRNILLVEDEGERQKARQIIAEAREGNDKAFDELQATVRSEEGKAILKRVIDARQVVGGLYEPMFKLLAEDPVTAKRFVMNDFVTANTRLVNALGELEEYQLRLMNASVMETRHTSTSNLMIFIVTLVISFAVAIMIALWILRSVTRPLDDIRATVKAVNEDHDFTKNVVVQNRDEVGETAESFNQLLNALRTTFRGLQESIASIDVNAKQLDVNAQESAKAAELNSSSAASMAASVEEMSVSISHVAENAREAMATAQQAGDFAQSGGQVITDAVAEMQRIAASVKSFSETVNSLGEQSHQISSIVQSIREVADQTNLLALNAAIEAARAGEAGRGFAVVADEVRKLAERTTLSAGEISTMINRMQGSTQSVVDGMKTTIEQVDGGTALAEKAGESIVEIQKSAASVVRMVQEISEAIAEQGAASQQIAQSVENVAQASEETSAASKNTSESANGLERLADQMLVSVNRYSI